MTPEEIIDRWSAPQFVANFDDVFLLGALYQMGVADNPVCGDSCSMFVSLKDGIIEDTRHLTQGCTITVVSADLLCEKMIGQRPDFEINLFELLGIPIGLNRRQCVLTPIQAFKEALQ